MNNKFEIKICGINDEISMNAAINCRANYIGLVFYQNSPRNVSFNLSKKLLKLRNKVSKIVALTVNPKDDFLIEIKKIVKPDYIQLHGNENLERCINIKKKIKFDIKLKIIEKIINIKA